MVAPGDRQGREAYVGIVRFQDCGLAPEICLFGMPGSEQEYFWLTTKKSGIFTFSASGFRRRSRIVSSGRLTGDEHGPGTERD
jgi:hypothetical protein